MDVNKVRAQLVKSISFEVEAIPEDNVVEITNTGKMTPLNVRVRVRKKEDGVVSNGILSIPRRDQPENYIQTLRLASSEMTIMSFNMLMEANLEQQVIKKPRKSFFGMCLGARGEKDDDKYMPSTADNKDMHTTSESNVLKLRNVNSLGKTGISAPHVYRKKDKFFGKCKPGGCLDPPFGEDKYAYQPQDKTRIKSLKAPAAATLVDTRVVVETENTLDSETADAANVKKKERETSSAIKVPKNENEEDGSILSLYQGEQKHNLDENDSDSIITYPPALSSSGLLLGGEKAEKNVARKTSGARQSRKSFNEFSTAYFSPPRTPRDSKDFSGRAERPKSYSTKDINQDSKLDSKSPRRASNTNTGVTSYPGENRKNSSDRTGVDFVGLKAAATVGAGATGIGIAAGKTGKSKDGESRKIQEKENLLQNPRSILNDDELADTQSGRIFPLEILDKGMTNEINRKNDSEVVGLPDANSQAKSVDPYGEHNAAMDNIVENNRAVRKEDSERGATTTGSIVKGTARPGVTGIESAISIPVMTGESQDREIGKNIHQNVSDAIKYDTKDLNIGVNQFPVARQTIKSEKDKVYEINGLAEIQVSSHSHFGEGAKTGELRGFVDVAANDGYGENVKSRAKQPDGMSDVEQAKSKEQKNIIGTAADENNGFGASQGDRSAEQFSPYERQQSKGRAEGIKRLRGQNKSMSQEDKHWGSTDSQGRIIQADDTEGEYSPERENLGNDYLSNLREDQEPYFHDGITESHGRTIPIIHTEGENSPKSGQKNNESSSKLEKDQEPIYQEGMNIRVRDSQGKIIPTGDMDRDHSFTSGQRRNECSFKLGENEPFSQVEVDQGAIKSQGRILATDDIEEEFSPNVRQIENNYTSKLGGDQEPFAQGRMDQRVKDPLGRNIQRGDTEREYSPIRGQRRNEYSSKLGEDEQLFPREIMNLGTIDSHISKDDEEREYSLKSEQRKNEHSSKLEEDQEPFFQEGTDRETYSKDGLGQKFATDKTAQKGFEEFQKYEGYDPTSRSDASAVGITRAKRQNRYGSTSGVKPTDQTTGSIFLNLAFQTNNEENQTTIKTLDTAKNNEDDRNVLFVKSLIKFGRGIAVPVSSQHIMNIEIKPAQYSSTDAKSRIPKSIAKFDSAKSEFRTSGLSIKDPHTALSVVYNKDLIPLRSVIKDLKEDINALAAQQMMLRDRLTTRRVKPYNNIKKCGCSRHSYPKI